MIQLLIIADDLTGAIDTGVQLAKQGIQTRVIPDPDSNYPDLFNSSESSVLVVNTESRHTQPQEAEMRVEEIMSVAQEAGIKRYFKKTDSTLRGNIGAELDAFKKNVDQEFVGFIPAHPKLKRFTRKGRHFIDNTPLHETSFGSDPLEPVLQNDIKAILANQTALEINSIDLNERQKVESADILVFDCESIDDLKEIADFLKSRNCADAIAGSAAMVELLPERYTLDRVKTRVSDVHSPALMINGSLNNISREQVRYVADQGFTTYSIPPEWLRNPVTEQHLHSHDLFLNITSALRQKQHVILTSTSLTSQHPKTSETDLKYDEIPRNLGLIIKAILKNTGITSLIVFGGDTLMGIMEVLQCSYMEPQTEILPGVALSLTEMDGKKLTVITKPGGYGEKDVIITIFDYLNKLS